MPPITLYLLLRLPWTPSCGGHLDSQGPTASPALKMEELVTHLVQARTFLSWRLSQPLQVRSTFHPITEPGVFVFPKHLLHGDVHRVGIHCMCPGQHSNPCGSSHSHTSSRKAKPSRAPPLSGPLFRKQSTGISTADCCLSA